MRSYPTAEVLTAHIIVMTESPALFKQFIQDPLPHRMENDLRRIGVPSDLPVKQSVGSVFKEAGDGVRSHDLRLGKPNKYHNSFNTNEMSLLGYRPGYRKFSRYVESHDRCNRV